MIPPDREFCTYCGAGIGKFKRYGEGTCAKCEPLIEGGFKHITPEQAYGKQREPLTDAPPDAAWLRTFEDVMFRMFGGNAGNDLQFAFSGAELNRADALIRAKVAESAQEIAELRAALERIIRST